MRIFTLLTLFGFIIGGLLLLFLDPATWLGDYARPHFMGGFALFWAGVLALPWLVFRLPKDSGRTQELLRARQVLQLGIAIGIILNGLGTLGLYELYKVGFQYDKLAHFLSPAVFVFTICYFAQHWYQLPLGKTLAIVATIVVIGGFGWELGEWATDEIFNTVTLGIYGQQIGIDTFWDLIADIGGVLAGMLIYNRYFHAHKSSAT